MHSFSPEWSEDYRLNELKITDDMNRRLLVT